jgi:hypothetical protein
MRPEKIVRIQQTLELIAMSASIASSIIVFAINVMPWLLDHAETIGFKPRSRR